MATGLLIFSIVLIVIAIVNNRHNEQSAKTIDDLRQDVREGHHHSGVYNESHDVSGHIGGREGSHSHHDGGDAGGGGDGGGG